MTSLTQTPSRYNDYRGTSDLKLTPDIWNSIFGDISARLKVVEAKGDTWDDLVAQGADVALQRVNTSLEPAVDQITALIQKANVYLSQLQQTAGGFGAGLITTDPTHRFVTDTQIAAINKITDILASISALQSAVATPDAGRSYFISSM